MLKTNLHRECLASAGLAVRKNSRIVTFQYIFRCWFANSFKDLALTSRRISNLIFIISKKINSFKPQFIIEFRDTNLVINKLLLPSINP
jgi:hypothetical protein